MLRWAVARATNLKGDVVAVVVVEESYVMSVECGAEMASDDWGSWLGVTPVDTESTGTLYCAAALECGSVVGIPEHWYCCDSESWVSDCEGSSVSPDRVSEGWVVDVVWY